MNTITETTKRLWYCSRTGLFCEYAGEQYCHMTVCAKEQGTYKTCIEIKATGVSDTECD